MADAAHPQRHLWPALQRRFSDQNKPSTAPDRLLRGLCCVPLDGQEESAAWTLGFREVGATLRTASLARDFQALASMVDPAAPCYLVVYVGDVPEIRAAQRDATVGSWMLVAYVPSTCSSFEARKMADNRAGLKAGLGAEKFADGGLWCVHVDQISLSNYMRSLDASGGAADEVEALPRSPVKVDDPPPPPPATTEGKAASRPGSAIAALGVPGFEGGVLPDATEAIWEQRIKGVRNAYKDSCSRLVGALEELEQTLCNLTGDKYEQDEPLLRARAHMAKNLELMR